MFEDKTDQTPQDSSDASATNDINEDISNRQDDLAKNWEKRLDETHIINDELDAFFKSEPEESYRLLSQNEIDSILGFTDKNTTKKDGVHAILASEMIYYERLPMLEVVFDRFVRMMTTSLRNFTSDNVEIILDSITTVRFGDYLNGIPLPAMLSVFRAEEWDNYGLLTIDSPLIYSIVDVLLGGRRGTAVMRIEGRPYTTIERSLVERLIYLILTDLGSSFNPISTVNFKFERLETNPRFATIGRPSNAAVLVQLRIEMEDRGGKIDLILPYATLEPIRELLLQNFMGEKFGRDTIWENHLASELWYTDVTLEAILGFVNLPLKEVLEWQIGSQILLNTQLDDGIEVVCGHHQPIYKGKLGRTGRNLAIKVESNLIALYEE